MVFSLAVVGLTTAQEPPTNLRLLAWSVADSFWVGETPGKGVTLDDGTTRQLIKLWLLPTADAPARYLADGFEPTLNADKQQLIFTRFDAIDQGGM